MSRPDWTETLRQNVAASRPVFAGLPFDNVDLLDSCLPGLSKMTLTEAQASATNGGIELKGRYQLLDFGPLPATIDVTGTSDNWTGNINVAIPASNMSLPFARQVAVSELKSLVAFSGGQTMLTGASLGFALRISVGGKAYSYRLAPTPASSHWALSLDEASLDLAGLSAMLDKLGIGDALGELPLDQLAGSVSVTDLALYLRQPGGIPDGIQFTVRAEHLNSPIAAVKLEQLCFAIAANNLGSSENRQVSASFSADLRCGPVTVDIFGQYPPLRFGGAMTCESGVSIHALYKALVGSEPPIRIPELELRTLEVDADLGAPALLVRASVAGNWAVPGTEVELSELSFDLQLSADNPHVSVYALTSVAGSDVAVSATIGPELEFSGSLDPATLTELLGRFGLEKPAEVPEVHFGPIDVVIDGPRKIVRISASAEIDFDFLGAGKASRLQIAVDVDAAPGRKPAVVIAVSSDATITFDGDVTLRGFSVDFASQADGSWKLGGTIGAAFLGDSFELAANYEKSGGASVFTLAIRGDRRIVNIEDVAQLTLKSFGIAVHPPAGDSQNRRFSIDAIAHLRLADLASFDAALSVGTDGIFLKPEGSGAEVEVPLPFPGSGPSAPAVKLGIGQVSVQREPNPPSGEATWELRATGSAQMVRVPHPAGIIFRGDPTTASIVAGRNGFAIEIHPPGAPGIALVFGKGSPWEVEFPEIAVASVALRRARAGERSEWQLAAQLTVKDLDRLNRITGGAEVFRKSVDVDVIFGTGFGVRPKSSPFSAIELRTKDDQTVWTEFFDFFGAGRMSFRVPQFSFDFGGGRWNAARGVETDGALRIPLKPIRWLAEKCRVPPAVIAPMPDALPLTDLDLRDPRLYDQLVKLLGRIDPSVQPVLRKLADLLREGIDRFPERLNEYLVLHVPTSFVFDAGVEPGGGAWFGLRTEDGQPLKVLLPGINGVPPLPSLTGITLRGVSFGLTAGGQLGVLTVDGHLDQFDAVSLIYALATGDGAKISNRVIMKNMKALIPMAAPLPIPLFYDQIGWEYRNFLGLQLQLHGSFPDPKPGLADWVRLIVALLKFFLQQDYLLHEPDNLPAGMQLSFQIQPTFLALPDYLGGAALGDTASLPSFPVSQTLARALDSIKTGNLGLLIQSIPLRYELNGTTKWIRVGSDTVCFGPLTIKAAWCITTEREFRDVVLKDDAARKELALAHPEKLLDCTPARFGGDSYEKGFVVLLMGGVDAKIPLTSIFQFETQFGVALLGPRDFQTGVRVFGSFGPSQMLSLEIRGYIGVRPELDDAASTEISVKGHVTLTVLSQPFTSSSRITVIPGKLFKGQIAFELTKHLQITGNLTIDDSGALIDGFVLWSGLPASPVKIGSSARFSKNGLSFTPIALKIGAFACSATLDLPGKGKGDAFTFGVLVQLPSSALDEFRQSLVATADKVVAKEVATAYDDLLDAMASQRSFEVSLEGVRKWVPGLCRGIIKAIRSGTAKKNVYQAMDTWANSGGTLNKVWRIPAVAAAKLTKPENVAKASAQEWIDKLNAVVKAASAPIRDADDYRKDLQNALTRLKTPNTVTVRIARVGRFPGLQVYQQTVLDKQQLKQLGQAIDAIGGLKKASTQRISSEAALKRMPKSQQVLAEVRRNVKAGMLKDIPEIRAVGFDASAGAVSLASLALNIAIKYRGETITYRVTANLANPLELPQKLAKGFADAF